MCVCQLVLLTSPKSSHPTQLLSRQQPAPISPLAATLMRSPVSVANKELTGSLSPLDSALTKNRGVGVLWVTSRVPQTSTEHGGGHRFLSHSFTERGHESPVSSIGFPSFHPLESPRY